MKAKKVQRSNRVASDDGLGNLHHLTPNEQAAMDRALRKSVRIVQRCYDCKRYIVAEDDDAHVCIECGGRNRLAVVAVA